MLDRLCGTQVFTPQPVAAAMAELAGQFCRVNRPVVVDPACGDGQLLEAARRLMPERLIGIDLDAAMTARAARRCRAANIRTGDALDLVGELEQSADVVLLNPPYLGEKGHRALFEATARLSDRWARRTVARMDYLYYFLHLALDLLVPGGVCVAITTAYWPSATSAATLRADLTDRADVLRWWRLLGDDVFVDARGQRNLIVVFRKHASDELRQNWGWRDVEYKDATLHLGPLVEAPKQQGRAPWQPFISAADASLVEQSRAWTPLSELATDRQGVVSGCDRVVARHGMPELVGRPVFLLTAEEIRERGWQDDPTVTPLLEPLLRGSSCTRLSRADTRRAVGEEGDHLLYLDRNSSPPNAVLAHLEPVRPLLEKRREVKQGTVPWWSLHWPRNLTDMRRPKLVCARRCKSTWFCLDLAGHVVSSDCTFLTVEGDDVELLSRLWRVLQTEDIARLARATGKHKGNLLELYSEPLRRLRVPLAHEGS